MQALVFIGAAAQNAELQENMFAQVRFHYSLKI